jgi:alpha-beta hydrolase superfamily lysophospholipase
MRFRPTAKTFRRLLLAGALFMGLPATVVLSGFGPTETLSRQFFLPFERRAEEPDVEKEPYEQLWLQAVDGSRLEAWAFSPRGEGPRSGLVLHAHGNAGNLSVQWRLVSGLADSGFEVLTFDYRGYGRSGGQAGRDAARDDLRTALAVARERAGGQPVFVYGQSIGGALALEVLAEESARAGVSALAVDAPFDSWAGIAALHLSRDGWLRGPLDAGISAAFRRAGVEPLEAATRLGSLPLLVITGTADRICPHEMSLAIHAAAPPGSLLLSLPEERHVGLREAETRSRVLAEVASFFHDAS